MENKPEEINTQEQEEDKKIEPDSEISIANAISIGIIVICYVIGFFILFSGHIRVSVFIIIGSTILNFGITKPLALVLNEYKGGKAKGITFHRLVFGISIVYLINAIYSLYQIIYTYPLNEYKLYWLCKLIVILLLPYTFLIHYNNIIDRKDDLCKEAGTSIKRFWETVGLVSHKTIPLFVVFALNYQSSHVIDLERINAPQNIAIINAWKSNLIYVPGTNELRTLEFPLKEMSFLIEEIKKHSLENLRYIELLNFNMEEEAREESYSIYLDYENAEDRYITLDNNRRVRLDFIDVYEDEIIINTHDKQRIIDKKDDKYRLKLPREVIQRLQDMIKTKVEQRG